MLISCSNASKKLTHSKAESILTKCLEKGSAAGKTYFDTGNQMFNPKKEADIKELEFLKTLENEGLLKLEYISGKLHHIYNIELTEKAEAFVLEKDKKGIESVIMATKSTKALVKTFDHYVVSEIKQIHEIPENNTATVTAVLEKIELTPFFSINNESKFKEVKLTFLFTSNGWGYCK
jgi:hypothetical protein